MAKIYQASEVKKALSEYQKTDIISFPTDTVYGIGANLFNERAIEKIYQTKHRPGHKPLAVLCANKDQILKVAKEIPEKIDKLISQFMPGALTVILPKRDEVPDYVTSNLKTVGVRIPNHPVALEILEKVGPLATTSANISGDTSLNDAKDVMNALGEEIDIIIDGGLTDIQIPSTVVAINGEEVVMIREGSIKKEEIKKLLDI